MQLELSTTNHLTSRTDDRRVALGWASRALPLLAALFLVACAEDPPAPEVEQRAKGAPILHWFIPDGMRADPELFDIYRWAEEGKLPNIKKMMDTGSYGFSVPTFPAHTPTNFATLLTGASPRVHGVADGPMHTEGHPLVAPSVGGFRSTARKVPAIWSILEERGHDVVLLSVPGSTPPELTTGGITIRGRWGGWGADYHSLVFETASEEQGKNLARAKRLFFLGYELTCLIEPSQASTWSPAVQVFEAPIPLELEAFGARMHAAVVDTTDDSTVNYDRLALSIDGAREDAVLAEGEWSHWFPVSLTWRDRKVSSQVRFNVVKLRDDGFFRVRMLVDNINEYIVAPDHLAGEVAEALSPMVDFVDNFPPQLIYYPEDQGAFLDELGMSFAWHGNAVELLYEEHHPDVFIHDIYSPNQMLTGRWWMGYIDPASSRYDDVSETEREQLWGEVLEMYQSLDAILGAALERAGDDTVVVLSSDHGAAPLDRWVRLNNLFHEKGWLTFRLDPTTHEPVIDWERTKVVYLKMCSVFIDPEGLGGDWNRASGPAYEALRNEVREALESLEDEGGVKPVAALCGWEDAEETFRLPGDRVGDLVIANRIGYGWNEEVTESGELFDVPLKTGYKQAILAESEPALWAPFMIVGPGIKRNHRLPEPIEMVDQLPTIMTALGQEIPDHVEGRVLDVFD